MCKGHCIECSETVSVVLKAATDKYPLPSNLNANDYPIRAISVRPQNAAGTAMDYGKNVLAPDAVLASGFLELKEKGEKTRLSNLSLDYLAYRDSMFTCSKWNPLDSNKSNLNLNSAAAGFTAGQVIEITFFYDCPSC